MFTEVAVVVISDFNYWIASCEIPWILNDVCLFIYTALLVLSTKGDTLPTKGGGLQDELVRKIHIFQHICMPTHRSGHYVNNSSHGTAIILRILWHRAFLVNSYINIYCILERFYSRKICGSWRSCFRPRSCHLAIEESDYHKLLLV